MNITKKIIASRLSKDLDISQEDASNFFKTFLNVVSYKANNKYIKISGFGSFKYSVSKERLGRNPKTLKNIKSKNEKLHLFHQKKLENQLINESSSLNKKFRT